MKGLKLILRQWGRNRLFTFLNIIGLAIGISASWIVFRIVNYEFSFDRNHPDKERIYKLYSAFKEGENIHRFDGTPYPLGAYLGANLKKDLTGLELVAPIANRSFESIKVKRSNNETLEFNEQDKIISATVDYFKLVPYKWIVGNPNTALKNNNEIILTASRARQYFTDADLKSLLGKTMQYDDQLLTVTGVVADLDYPSSFISKEFIRVTPNPQEAENWENSSSNFHVYVKLTENGSPAQVIGAATKKFNEMVGDKFKQHNITAGYELAPLTGLHFNKFVLNSSDKQVMFGLIGIAAFLLILASINYINLTTARVPARAREIGIRKTLGEQPRHLTLSFIKETFFTCLFGLLFSWPLVKIFELTFSSYLPQNINAYSDGLSVFVFLLGLIILLTLISSLYPAYLINKVHVVEAIKIHAADKISFGSISLRKILIVFQFVIAQAFVVLTVIMGLQLQHALHSNVGFQDDAVITLKLPYKKAEDSGKSPFLLKELLQKYPEIDQVSLGHLPMNNDQWGNNIMMQSDTGQILVNMPFKYIEENYLDVFQMKLLAGRPLKLSDTTSGILINQKAISKFGFKTPVEALGKTVTVNDRPTTIVGILADFHNFNLHAPIEPLAMQISTNKGTLQNINIKLNGDPKKWHQAIASIKTEWKNVYPNAPFTYQFYDERIKELYEKDYRFYKIINLSTSITILLSCLGLIGLVTLTTHQRTKEIGIRKILGSTISGIVLLLSKDYIKLIVISILIATPIAWLAIDRWLTDFAFKIELSSWMFIIPAIVTIGVAFLAMSYQSVSAARANPVDSLRDE
ncbi:MULTISPECIES: ABC transporter permease [unclassified Sphingobacterium]|uniref:ABC transporter permease n=1 Tax=unclassified Sphingobacterium TaxID=2609468 RepID=UPI0025F8C0FD|nr:MULTISPECIES: ABC transporter permease [unclassified Sphingobacterium]